MSVIVSLRSSESERRWCGFTPRGGKHRWSQQPLSDGRSKALQLRGSPTPANHDEAWEATPPLESLLCIQRGTVERALRKKKKSWRFRDHKLHLIICWLSSSGTERVYHYKVGFIRPQRRSAAEIGTTWSARLERPALESSAPFGSSLTHLQLCGGHFMTPPEVTAQ
ncbi:hypothetical protein Q8A73_005341 [Channa argus]|nr:hypothetical protein Q8A73_005341 [Channa argus]